MDSFVSADNKNILDFSVGSIKGERKIHQVIHSHSKLELSLVKRGKGKYHIGSKIYDINEGDIFIINNIEPHGIELEKDEELTNMVLHFEPRFVWQETNDFDQRFLKIFFDRNECFCHKLDNTNNATMKIKELFLDLEDEFNRKEAEYELMVKVKLLNILVLLLRHYGYVKEAVHVSHQQEVDIINTIISYIDFNYAEGIKLQDLAELAHMNTTYFSTFFKKYNGLSPIDYIVRKRITRALDYLCQSEKSVMEIAGLCGFNNATHFNKMFKKITGVTPTMYRRKYYEKALI